jgi:hypothetical protein
MKKTIEEQQLPYTPLRQLYNFMKQNNYTMSEDLLDKYHELREVEHSVMQDAFFSGYDIKIKKDE